MPIPTDITVSLLGPQGIPGTPGAPGAPGQSFPPPTAITEAATLNLAMNTAYISAATGTLNTIAFSGSPVNGNVVRLDLKPVSTVTTVTVPANVFQVGGTSISAVTTVTFQIGVHELSFIYTGTYWLMSDTSSPAVQTGDIGTGLVNIGLFSGAPKVKARVLPVVSSATPTIDTDNYDGMDITALATAITSMTTNLTGTPDNFDQLFFRIKDNGSPHAISWGAKFAARGVALPTTTVTSKILYALFIWNSTATTWDCISTAQEA